MDIINCEVTEEVENKIWREAVIVFDTSSLLNIYDLSDNSKEDFIQKNYCWFKAQNMATLLCFV